MTFGYKFPCTPPPQKKNNPQLFWNEAFPVDNYQYCLKLPLFSKLWCFQEGLFPSIAFKNTVNWENRPEKASRLGRPPAVLPARPLLVSEEETRDCLQSGV